NISNFYGVMGEGNRGRAQADSLFGNLNLKIFHANGEISTNEWAASLIGKSKQWFVNASNNYEPNEWGMSGGISPRSSGGVSEHYEWEVQPSVFTQLRTGGKENKGLVDGVVVTTGRCFKSTGRPWMFVTFKQK